MQIFDSAQKNLPEIEKTGKKETPKGCYFHPFFALQEVDALPKEGSFLIGTTNQLFLNYAALKADLVINLDQKTLVPTDKQALSSL